MKLLLVSHVSIDVRNHYSTNSCCFHGEQGCMWMRGSLEHLCHHERLARDWYFVHSWVFGSPWHYSDLNWCWVPLLSLWLSVPSDVIWWGALDWVVVCQQPCIIAHTHICPIHKVANILCCTKLVACTLRHNLIIIDASCICMYIHHTPQNVIPVSQAS